MTNDKRDSEVKQSSEFQTVLENFKTQLNRFDEFSSIILEKTCALYDYREPSPQGRDNEELPNGIIGELKGCLNKMDDYNDRLSGIKNGLTKIIG